MSYSTNWKAHLSLLSANLIYGINYSVAKIAMPEYIQPLGFVLLRTIAAVPFFWMISLFIKKSHHKLNANDWLRVIMSAFFGVTANQLLFFQGLELTTAFSASVLMTSVPLLVFMFSALILKQTITLLKSFGILLGLSGALLMIFQGKTHETFAPNATLGNVFVFLNAVSFASYLIISLPLLQKIPPIELLKWTFTIGLFFVIPFGWDQLLAVPWESFTPQVWLAIAFVLIFVSCISYLLNIYALSKLSPNIVSSYIYTQPVFASIIAIFIFGEPVTYQKILATIFVFLGVYITSFLKEDVVKRIFLSLRE